MLLHIKKRDDMQQRFVSVWFRYLNTDWYSLRQPDLKKSPLVLRTNSHGRAIITSVNKIAEQKGITVGMTLADARVLVHDLQVFDDQADLPARLLQRLAEWCIRFTPIVSIDLPNGLLMDVTGCAHLWGGEQSYLNHILSKLIARGYHVHGALADTIGVAWGATRFIKGNRVIESTDHYPTLLNLPPQALRIETDHVDRLYKLGFHQVKQFITMPRTALRRRFGAAFLLQLDKATGRVKEMLDPVIPPDPYHERLPCLEPIATRKGIEIAMQQLLETLCLRLREEQKGLRGAMFKGYRIDGKTESVSIVTNRPSHHVTHLFKLFELKLDTIEPTLGIELFTLDAQQVEEHLPQQETFFKTTGGLEDERLSELIDRIASHVGNNSNIHRFLPQEHYWPERSFKSTSSLSEEPSTHWREDKPRPMHLLTIPQRVEVTALIPDHPPMLFRYKNKVYPIVKADGPERIEQEWWLQQGEHRDYYRVEDDQGKRYWLFRLGHYHDKVYQWFLHGYFF